MYTSFYRLDAKPFQIASDPTFIWLGEKHKEALATLTYGVMDSKGFMLLTGDVGTGKTTLINTLIKGLSDDVIYASVPDPRLGLNDFLNYIANAFDIRRSFKSKGKFLIYFSEFLARCANNNKKVLLLIDEAQLLTQEMLEEIRLLSNIQKDGMNLLNIFFVGQDEFNEILDRQENRAVAQRITLNYHLKPLTDQETEQYIKHRLGVAGMTRQIFDAEAYMEIYRCSGGFPRRINIICDHCLLTGFVREQQVLGADVVRYCAQELRIPQSVRRTSAPQAPPYQPQPQQQPVVPPGRDAVAPGPAPMEAPVGGQPAVGEPRPQHPPQFPPQPQPPRSPLPQLAPQRPMPRMRRSRAAAPLVLLLALLGLGAGFLYMYDRPLFDTLVDSAIRQVMVVKENIAQPPSPAPQPEPVVHQEEVVQATRPTTSAFPPAPQDGEPAAAKVVPQPAAAPQDQAVSAPAAEPPPASPSAVGLEQSIVIAEDQAMQDQLPADEPLESAGSAALLAEQQMQADEAAPSPVVPELPEKTILVRFNNDSSEFYFADFAGIDSLVAGMKEYPDAILVIAGHTDSFGSEGYNYRLSLFRANMVKSFFLGKGIPSHQLKVKAFGSEKPVASNETEEGRAMNRRVEIDVLQ